MRFLFLGFLLLATCSFAVDNEECRVEADFQNFFYQNGGNPPIDSDVDKAAEDAVQEALDRGEDWLKTVGGSMAHFLKGANFWITLSSDVSTNRLAFHAGIICTYRVIHKNKIVSDVKVWKINKLEDSSGNDWFPITETAWVNKKLEEKEEEMMKTLNEDMKEECPKKHRDS